MTEKHDSPGKAPADKRRTAKPNRPVNSRAFAVQEDGHTEEIKAGKIVLRLPNGELEISLRVAPIVAGQICISARGGEDLVVGHGDASSVHIALVSEADE